MAVFRPEIASSGVDGFEGFFLRREELDVLPIRERGYDLPLHLAQGRRTERGGLLDVRPVSLGELDHELHRFHVVGAVEFGEIEKYFHFLPRRREILLDDTLRRGDGCLERLEAVLRHGSADLEEYVPLRFDGYLQWFVHTFYCLNQT